MHSTYASRCNDCTFFLVFVLKDISNMEHARFYAFATIHIAIIPCQVLYWDFKDDFNEKWILLIGPPHIIFYSFANNLKYFMCDQRKFHITENHISKISKYLSRLLKEVMIQWNGWRKAFTPVNNYNHTCCIFQQIPRCM